MPDRISKFINSLDKKTKDKVKEKLLLLRSNPYTMKDVKKLRGTNDLYRLRLGKIRIIYRISNALVEVVDIDYRGNIY